MDQHYLASLFAPKSVAVLYDQATPPETLELLTARMSRSDKIKTWFLDHDGENWPDEPHQIDSAIIATGPDRTEAAIEDAARRRAKAAVVLTTGIAQAKFDDLRRTALRLGVSLLGPSSMGMQCPGIGLDASLLSRTAKPGRIALVSQSGALASAILDWADVYPMGFSAVVTLGNEIEVDLAQVLDYLAFDVQTQSIIVYLECIRDARSFMSAMRAAASVKPVIVLKAGRNARDPHDPLTHSSALIGANAIIDTALRRAGAVRVQYLVQLFSTARVLTARRRPTGRRVAILSNGRGPALLAQDLLRDEGYDIVKLTADTVEQMKARRPDLDVNNPLNLRTDAQAQAYADAIELIAHDKQVDGLLVIHTPTGTSDEQAIAEAVAKAGAPLEKAIFGCWMGEQTTREQRGWLSQQGIPSFRTPEAALDAMMNVATFYANQQLAQQVPPPLSNSGQPDIEGARMIVEAALAEKRRVLTEMESKALLSAFHIPVATTVVARNANEAVMIAQQVGFPVALKINSSDIPHKSEVGGVVLGLRSGAEVRSEFNELLTRVRHARPDARIDGVAVQAMVQMDQAREVFVGVKKDPLFGPVITFGAGGTMVELIRDRATELPPLNSFLALRLIERTRVASRLGANGTQPAANLEAIEQLLVRVSEMICELPSIKELDINPVLVDNTGAIAVDARVVVENAPPMSRGRYSHLAILPYPSYLHWEYPLPDGSSYNIRPIRWEDSLRLQEMVRALSEESRYFRFISNIRELPPRLLVRYTQIDYHRDMALVAVVEDADHEEKIIGVARYMLKPDGESCEFAIVISDEWHGRGLGSRLMNALIDVGAGNGLRLMEGYVLAQNSNMLKLMSHVGFSIHPDPDDPTMRIVKRPL